MTSATDNSRRPSLMGFIEYLDENSNRFYYYNPITEATQWNHPSRSTTVSQSSLSSLETTDITATTETTTTETSIAAATVELSTQKALEQEQREGAATTDEPINHNRGDDADDGDNISPPVHQTIMSRTSVPLTDDCLSSSPLPSSSSSSEMSTTATMSPPSSPIATTTVSFNNHPSSPPPSLELPVIQSPSITTTTPTFPTPTPTTKTTAARAPHHQHTRSLSVDNTRLTISKSSSSSLSYSKVLTLSQQFTSLLNRERLNDENDDQTNADAVIHELKNFDVRRPFSPKEKLIVLHLVHLTSKEDQVKLNVFEEEIFANIVFRVCLYGRSTALIEEAVEKYPDLAKAILPTSHLCLAHVLVGSGNDQAVIALMNKLDFFRGILDRPANNNLTPLHIACLFGLDAIVKLLLDQKAYLETECSGLPYFLKRKQSANATATAVAMGGDVMGGALGRSLSSSSLLSPTTALSASPSTSTTAASTSAAGFLQVINYWKNHVWTSQTSNSNSNKKFCHVASYVLNTCEHYVNPLLFAVMGGSMTTLRIIMDYKPTIEVKVTSKDCRMMCCPLTLSCVMGYDQVTQYLLSVSKELPTKFDVDMTDINGVTPLILNSMAYGSGGVTEVLVKSGANMNQIETVSGNSALHIAINNSFVDVLKGFVVQAKGTEDLAVLMNATNQKQFFTPLQLAHELHFNGQMAAQDYKQFTELLIANGAQNKRVYSEIVREGWLCKEGHVYKTLRERYFILSKTGVLSYYKDIRKLKNPSGEIYLYNAIVQKEPQKRGTVTHPLVFSVYDTIRDKKTYMFCEFEETRDAWLEAIDFCIKIAKKDQ